MRDMKDSGISWIGLIPNNWSKTCISYVSSSRSGGTPNRDNPLYWQGGTIPWMSSGEVNKEQVWETKESITQLGSDNSSAKILHPNSVMVALNGQGKTKGMAAVLKIRAACNQSLCAIHCDDNILYYQYLYYCFKSMYKYLRSQAGDDLRDGLAASFVIKQVVPIPPRNEQQIIADFLDRKCTDIDNVLEKTKASIEEYKKLKQSVITEAVTKGIHGERPMKDSGIEWIGKIPEKWIVEPLWGTIRRRTEVNHPNEMVLSLYRDYGIIPKDSRDDNHNVTSLYTSNYKYVRIGDLVVNKMKAWQGSMAISDYEGIVSPAYHVCEIFGDKFIKKYLHHLLRNQTYLPEYLRLSTGMRVGQWDLSYDDLRHIPVIIPPLEEQAEIISYIDKKCSEIDSLIASKEKFISELESYKKSLIYEYVTGKKEVPSNI